MSDERPLALKLAEFSTNWGNRMKTGLTGIDHTIAAELRRQHARIQELEAMLEAVGAGGVSAQRVTQAAQAPATAIQERDKFEQLMAASYPNLSFERHSYQYDHNRFAQYKVQWLWEGWQARAALDASDHIEQPLEMVAAREPFGYFKAEPFGWRDCAETDEGAIALYEAPQPQADALDAERWGSEPFTGTPFLQEDDQHLLDRLIETLEDGEGFDIGKEAIKRLANLGVAESIGFGRYGVTMFGYWVNEHYWYQNPSLPLKTNLDRDADARAAIAAAKEMK